MPDSKRKATSSTGSMLHTKLIYADINRVTRVFTVFLLTLILIYGATLRWRALRDAHNEAPWPDTVSVASKIEHMRHPYDTGVREPLWLWTGWLVRSVVPDPLDALRYASVGASLLILLAGYFFIRDYLSSRTLAVAGAWLLATHETLVRVSAYGHRTELIILASTALFYVTLVPNVPKWRRAIIFGVSTAAAILTSLPLLVSSGVMGVWIAWRARLTRGQITLAASIIALTVAPHLAYNVATFGTPSYFSSRMVPTFYRNYEFIGVKHTGCDGCPTADEYARNAYAGAPVTMAEYLFGLHTPGEVLTRIVRGVFMVYVWRGPELHAVTGGGSRWRVWSYWAGAMLAIVVCPLLLVVLLLVLNLAAFIVPLGIEVRLLTSPVVLAATLQLLPVWWLFTRARLGSFESPQPDGGNGQRALRLKALLNRVAE